MSKTPIIQVCFSLKSNLTNNDIYDKMVKLKAELDRYHDGDPYLVKSCHLTKPICEDAGFDTAIPDMFETVFHDQYQSELTETDFKSAMANMNQHREELARKADRLVLLAGEEVGNVSLELKLFTNSRVIVI